MYLSKNIKFLIKELNKNKSKITKVFFTIFISLLIFSSVTILKNSIENEVKNNSRAFLGGDLEISTKNKPLNTEYLNQLKDSFFLSEVIEFTSIIKNNNEESKTTRIKVIDDFYPLVGKAKVEPANSLKLLQTKQNAILIDKTTKDNLNLKIGDKIDGLTIGEINGNRFKPLKKDGTLSNSPKAKQVNSGIIGYADRYARIPYCRTTEFTYKHFEQYKKSLPYIRYISNLFKKYVPERWAKQKEQWDLTNDDFKIKDTVFTTVTVNKNFRTASHYDAGDLEEGFGNLAVLQTGDYTGGYTVMPKYGIGLNVRNFDLALFDVHELHGNTEIKPKGFYERISVVCYFRKKMIECGSAKEELERIKHK